MIGGFYDMKCPICGEQISRNDKFCPGCGNPVQSLKSKGKPVTLQCNCKNCGGMMNFDQKKSILLCPFCGAKEIVIEDEDITIQRIKSQAYKEVELKKLEQEERQKQEKEASTKARKYSRGCLGIGTLVCCIFAFLMGLAATISEDYLSGTIAIVQGVLFLYSWLVGRNAIKKSRVKYTVPLIIALILVIPFCATLVHETDSTRDRAPEESYAWPVGTIADAIPEPDGELGTIYHQSDDSFSMDVSMAASSDFAAYVNACKEKGFSIDVKSSERSFNAYNEEGYRLDLYYFDSYDYMSISLDAPIKMSTLHWPNSDLAQTIPVPKSNLGYVVWENSDGFDIYVGDTSEDDFTEYISACQDAGYDVNYYKGNGYFNADDENGNSLSVYYEGNKTMQIHLYRADD